METYLSYRERLEISKRKKAEQIRRRVITLCIIALVFASTILAFTQKASADTTDKRVKSFVSIEIKAGDTLWSIAETYYTEECLDFASYLNEIKKTNHIFGDHITAGNYLIVPCYIG